MGNATPLTHVVASNEKHVIMSGRWWPSASQNILTPLYPFYPVTVSIPSLTKWFRTLCLTSLSLSNTASCSTQNVYLNISMFTSSVLVGLLISLATG